MGKIVPICFLCGVALLGVAILYNKTYENALKAKWGAKNDAAITAIIRAQETANKKKEKVDEAIRQLVDGPNNVKLDQSACRVLEEAGLLTPTECPIRTSHEARELTHSTDRP